MRKPAPLLRGQRRAGVRAAGVTVGGRQRVDVYSATSEQPSRMHGDRANDAATAASLGSTAWADSSSASTSM